MKSVLVKACGATSWNVAAGQKREVCLDLGLGVGVGLPTADCTYKSRLCVTDTCPSLPLFLHRWAMESERERERGTAVVARQWREEDLSESQMLHQARADRTVDNVRKRGWPLRRNTKYEGTSLCALTTGLITGKKKLYYYIILLF